ncbi:NAD(P)/FAD-dependent oxidoreductase [Streptomyces hirsutus]
MFACGDAAAVPDLENPGQYTPMTAQHAWRQGKVCAHNVAASFGDGEPRAYRHSDLGFVVDLGGVKAAANPLGVHLSGPAAGAVTRGYHLAAMPGNRARVAADWLLDAVLAAAGGAVGARTVLVGAAGHRVPGSGQGAPRPGTEEVRRGGRRAGPRARPAALRVNRGGGPAPGRPPARTSPRAPSSAPTAPTTPPARGNPADPGNPVDSVEGES